MSEALTVMPGLVYYRAATLGSGSYGAVVQVYDDDGNEYAAKLFEEDEEESDDGYDEEAEDDDDDYEPSGGNDGALPIGVLREISILRFLNGAHPNIMRVQDVSELDQDGQRRLCMVMPKMQGDLSAAIANGSLQNKQKLLIAARLLHALSFMHSHGLIHRDIKPDNVLLDQDGNPVLADFSLAKQHNVDEVLRAAPTEQRGKKNRKRTSDKEDGRAAVRAAALPHIVNFVRKMNIEFCHCQPLYSPTPLCSRAAASHGGHGHADVHCARGRCRRGLLPQGGRLVDGRRAAGTLHGRAWHRAQEQDGLCLHRGNQGEAGYQAAAGAATRHAGDRPVKETRRRRRLAGQTA
eukprot:1762010-Pleurochrysis_carterae.AAC.2